MMDLEGLAAAIEQARGADRPLDRRLAIEVFGFRPNNSAAWPWVAPHGKHYRAEVPPYTVQLGQITVAIEQRWPGYRINASWAVDYAGVELFCAAPLTVEAKGRNLALALCAAAARLAAAEARTGSGTVASGSEPR